MEEAPRRGLDMDLLANAPHVQPVERLHRAVRLAMDRAEGGEVVPADEHRRAFGHRLDVQRHGNVPHAAMIERRRRSAIEDAVQIVAPDAGEAGVPVVGDRLDRRHGDRVGPDKRVEPLAQAMLGQRLRESTWAAIASAWTPASVRPAAWTAASSPVMRMDRLLERLLHRRAMVLPLPAHERPAVIFDRQPPAGHWQDRALRDREAAQQFVDGHRALARRAGPQRTHVAVARSDVQAIVEDFARLPGRVSVSSASSSLIRSPFASNQAPGDGSEGADLALDLLGRPSTSRSAPRPCRSSRRR